MSRKIITEEVLKNSSFNYKLIQDNEYVVEFEIYSNLPVFVNHKTTKYKVKRYLVGYKWNETKFNNYINKMKKELAYYSQFEKVIKEISSVIPGKPSSSKLANGKNYNTIHISFLQKNGSSVLLSVTEDLKKFSSLTISKSTKNSYKGHNVVGKYTQHETKGMTKNGEYVQSFKLFDLKELNFDQLQEDYHNLSDFMNQYI